ncbi:UNVERIFIED_CONTAM: Cysteine hydrolase [Siphonaria sp. JEL0065]|nr:Cysteine hydrolase [Siphonaria sp. JEL0065]
MSSATYKPALIIIDLQVAMFEENGLEGGPIYRSKEIIANTQSLLAWARKHNYPVAFIRHDGDGGFVPQLPSWIIEPQLSQRESEPTFAKNVPSAFSNPALLDWVNSNNVTEVVLAGAQTDFCVNGTTLGALQLGLKVTVVGDAHSTRDEWNGPLTAAQLIDEYNQKYREAGAAVVDTSSFI